MNQLPSEIFLLWSVSFLIKLSCKKLPPSLVKCVFFAVPPSGQNAKRPFKFLLFDFSMRRKVGHQNLILLFSIPSGANSFVCRVKINSRQEKEKSKSKWKILFTVCCCSVGESENGDNDTAATNFSQGRCLSQSTGTLPNFKDLLHKKIVAASSHPRTVLYPVAHPLTNRFYKKFLFVFVCFVSLVFFWSRELNFRQNNAKIQMKRKQNKN